VEDPNQAGAKKEEDNGLWGLLEEGDLGGLRGGVVNPPLMKKRN